MWKRNNKFKLKMVLLLMPDRKHMTYVMITLPNQLV